jgi:periplasmic protein TonB
MRRCLELVKARVAKERGEKPAHAHSPANRFEDPALLGPSGEARPLASVPSLVTDEDYPVSALRAGEQGRTSYRLTVGTNGRVTGCTITSSSGSAALDSTTCRILRARARFRPARDSKGEPVEASYEGAITWSLLPLDPAVPPGR